MNDDNTLKARMYCVAYAQGSQPQHLVAGPFVLYEHAADERDKLERDHLSSAYIVVETEELTFRHV